MHILISEFFSSLFIWRWWKPHTLLYCEVKKSFCVSQPVSCKLDVYCTHFTVVITSNYPHLLQSNSIFDCIREHVRGWLLLTFYYHHDYPLNLFIQYNSRGSIEEFALKHAAYIYFMVVACIVKWQTDYLKFKNPIMEML